MHTNWITKIAYAAVDEYWTSLGYGDSVMGFGYDQVREVIGRLLDDPYATPEKYHETQRQKLLADGWKPGAEPDYEKKTFTVEGPRHLLPYTESYCEEERVAHGLVVAVMRALTASRATT